MKISKFYRSDSVVKTVYEEMKSSLGVAGVFLDTRPVKKFIARCGQRRLFRQFSGFAAVPHSVAISAALYPASLSLLVLRQPLS
jgi:hypothetical protein